MKTSMRLLPVILVMGASMNAFASNSGDEGIHSIAIGLGVASPDFLGTTSASGLVYSDGTKFSVGAGYGSGGGVSFGENLAYGNHQFGIGVNVGETTTGTLTASPEVMAYLKPLSCSLGVSAGISVLSGGASNFAFNTLTPSLLFNPMGNFQVGFNVPVYSGGFGLSTLSGGIAYHSGDSFEFALDAQTSTAFTPWTLAPGLEFGSQKFKLGLTQLVNLASTLGVGISSVNLSFAIGRSYLVIGGQYLFGSTGTYGITGSIVFGI